MLSAMNTLYLGDCLYVLRLTTLDESSHRQLVEENVPDESVDLIYIDPPFNSKRSNLTLVNITFKAAQHTGKKTKGQLGLEME